jgi:hypothetical protein
VRATWNQQTEVKIAKLGSTNYYDDHLELRKSESDTNHWDMAAIYDHRQGRVVLPCIATKEQIPDKEGWRTSQYYGWGIAAFQAGDATNSSWHIGWAHWPDIGMWARDESTVIRIAYGTPFGGYTPPFSFLVTKRCCSSMRRFVSSIFLPERLHE